MIISAATLVSAWSALGSTVVHFLWQGALIGVLTGVALSLLRHRSSAARYTVASCALLLCLMAFVGTFLAFLAGTFSPAGDGARQVALGGGGVATYFPLGWGTTGIASWCWAIGVLCMAARYALQCFGAQRLKSTAVSAPDAHWQRAFQSLKEELGITRSVRLLRSGLAQVPMVVGWFSPIVLVPVSAFTALSPDQLRALLAHELAHIRRHDHLLNAAQAVVEIVLFFHPVVWWISKQVRIEREYCCDDSSVRLTGDPRLLAEALATMETLRIHEPMTRTVLAANGGPLMKRITRILGARLDGRTSLTSWQLPLGLALAGVLAFTGSAYAITNPSLEGDAALQDDMRPEARKVWAKLQAAVDAGKLTEAQAKEEFNGWRKRQGQKSDESDALQRVKAELEAAVKSGRITEAQAKEKLAGWKKSQTRQKKDPAAAKRVWAELEAMVKAGKMTEAQAKERFNAWQKSVAEKSDQVNIREAWAKLEAAVKAGKITEEQAKEKFAALRKAAAERAPAQRKQDPEAVIKRIAMAVEMGRLTPEQGKERIEAFMKSLAEEKAAKQKELEGVTLRIKQAVESGRITPEQGKARLEEYKQRASGATPTRTKEDPEAMIKKIKAAVDSGRITPEQAEERIKAYKKSLAEKSDKKQPVEKKQ